jgi:hypothetical protein
MANGQYRGSPIDNASAAFILTISHKRRSRRVAAPRLASLVRYGLAPVGHGTSVALKHSL